MTPGADKLSFQNLKGVILNCLLDSFKKDLESLIKSAHEARDAATHEENVAEDKYDTRGLEASYLAGAQARRAQKLEELLFLYKNIALKDLDSSGTVTAPALVHLEIDGQSAWYFLIPKGSSAPISHSGKTYTVITSQSPLGAELLNREQGESFELTVGGKKKEVEILQFH